MNYELNLLSLGAVLLGMVFVCLAFIKEVRSTGAFLRLATWLCRLMGGGRYLGLLGIVYVATGVLAFIYDGAMVQLLVFGLLLLPTSVALGFYLAKGS